MLDRRELIKSFLGAVLVAGGLKALPASETNTAGTRAAPDVKEWEIKVTMIGGWGEIGDIVWVNHPQFGGYFCITGRVGSEYTFTPYGWRPGGPWVGYGHTNWRQSWSHPEPPTTARVRSIEKEWIEFPDGTSREASHTVLQLE